MPVNNKDICLHFGSYSITSKLIIYFHRIPFNISLIAFFLFHLLFFSNVSYIITLDVTDGFSTHFGLLHNIVSLLNCRNHNCILFLPQISIPEGFGQMSQGGIPQQLPFDPVTCNLMQLIATILNCLAKNNPMVSASEASAERMGSSGDAFLNRANDIIR